MANIAGILGETISNNNADMADDRDAAIWHINTGVPDDPNVLQQGNEMSLRMT